MLSVVLDAAVMMLGSANKYPFVGSGVGVGVGGIGVGVAGSGVAVGVIGNGVLVGNGEGLPGDVGVGDGVGDGDIDAHKDVAARTAPAAFTTEPVDTKPRTISLMTPLLRTICFRRAIPSPGHAA
jgi:hypothetical protein